MQYHNASYSAGQFDVFWFEKNMQGDIVAAYDESGNKLVSYVYDANVCRWLNAGKCYSLLFEKVFG